MAHPERLIGDLYDRSIMVEINEAVSLDNKALKACYSGPNPNFKLPADLPEKWVVFGLFDLGTSTKVSIVDMKRFL